MKIHAVVSAASQTEVLKNRMRVEGIKHGDTFRADLSGVRIGEPAAPDTQEGASARVAPVFFCNMGPITVRKVIRHGDGSPLPEQVAVQGLSVEKAGFVTIRNALVTSNGAISVTIDAESKIVDEAF